MKMKRSAIAVSLIALALVIAFAVSAMIVPSAAVTYYANNTFEDYTLGALTNAANCGFAAPSKATVVDYGGNRVIKLETVPADASNTTGAKDANIDKNIVVKNSKITYGEVESVVLQARYFISADAKGAFQSQVYSFDTTATLTSSKYFLDLYKINLTSGTLHGKTNEGSLTLNKGAWNTVTMRLNLKTAGYELYGNGTLVTSGTLNRGGVPLNLTLNENQWIVAKLNNALTAYGGYIYVDDATITKDTGSDVDRVYAYQDFETLSEGTFSNLTTIATPSLAKVKKVNGSNVIELPTIPADPSYAPGGSDENVDKNIMLPNTAVAYSNEDMVYLRTEYFISENAQGTVQSQIYTFEYEDSTGATQSGTWFSLFTMNLGNGMLSEGGASSGVGTLLKNAWNTITVILDLSDCSMDYYINESYSFSVSASDKYKNMTIPQDKWIVAKLNKNLNNYEGYILIDNATFASYSEEKQLYQPDKTNANGEKLWYVDVTNSAGMETREFRNTEKFFNAKNVSFTPAYFENAPYENIVAPVPGGSIRLTNAAGIRFATQLDLDALEGLLALKENGTVKDVSIGTVITPRSYVDAAQVFTMEGLDSKLANSGSKYLNVKGKIGAYYGTLAGVTLSEGYDTCFVGSIANVKLGNRDMMFSAIGYVEVKLFNGDSVRFYSYEYDASTIANYSRSVQDIATKALKDYDAGAVAFTEKELLMLESFKNGATTLSLSSSAVIKDVQYTLSEFFFCNAAGVACRLTYEGANGWRLQANGKGYNSFDESGAGQALAMYLGEVVKDKTEQLVVTTDASTVKIATPGSDTYVTLNYTGSFKMQFHTAEGKAISNVTAITLDSTATATSSGTVKISGQLDATEAIYGGGERFDVVNRRGTAIDLYSCDNYNSTAGTYMAIPLFVTSRGAGLFVNRYENMTADFDSLGNDTWSIAIKNEMIDCYFYATGRISDALFGYTEISGHSSLPEEWAQGELICRYSPDLNGFEDDERYTTGYASYTDIPASELNDLGVSCVGYVNGKSWATMEEVIAHNNDASFNLNYLFRLKYDEKSNPTGITTSYARCYYLADDGKYYQAGAKGNPAGHGVKTIVNALIDAGMKPTAMVMEPFSWGDISTNPDQYEELKTTVEWLEARGIKSMFYMGVGSLSGRMSGYRPEYQVWATLTDKNGVVTQTYKIPKTSGTGTNPDVGTSSTQQYIDVTNPEAVDWYMNEIWGMMIDLGADGIKIDFCECMPDEGSFTGVTVEYDFYDKSVFDGDDIHNGYATYFISLFYKSMIEQKAAKNIPDGFVVLSRGGGIGSQRNPYLWEGDQVRNFEKIEDQLIGLINSGISGVPFMTYDLGGYAYGSSGAQIRDLVSVEEESKIFARAIEYTAFTSTIQSHGDVRHAYQMTEEVQGIYRNYTDLHELLIPYIQKYSAEACATGMPVVRAMVLEYQDDTNVYNLDGDRLQYMFGEALLVAPVTGDKTTKTVYLPAGSWLDLWTGETVESSGESVTVNAPLGKIPVYMNVECSDEDQSLLADVFNGETWKKISGVQLNIEKPVIPGDPWLEDPFVD